MDVTNNTDGDPNMKPKGKEFECSVCKTKFTYRTNLNRHKRDIHKKITTRERSSCPFAGCRAQFYHKTKLLSHLEIAHGETTDKTELTFPSLEDFYRWKMQEEAQEFVCFTKQRGDVDHLSVRHQHYICQRDGSSRSHIARGKQGRKTERRPKKGVIKTDMVCPARMLVKQCKKTGKVNVTYYKSHSHQPNSKDTQHHPIPTCVRNEIKEKLKIGLSVDQIHGELQNSNHLQPGMSAAVNSRLQRINKSQIGAIRRRMRKKGNLDEPESVNGDTECVVLEVQIPAQEIECMELNNQTEVQLPQELFTTQPDVLPGYETSQSHYSTRLQEMLTEILILLEDENVRRTMLSCITRNMQEMLALCKQEANSRENHGNEIL